MRSTKHLVGLSFPCECPLVAESGPSVSANFHDLNVRFGEKRTLHCCFRNAQINAKYLSVRMTAFPSKADIKLNLGKRSANDPLRSFGNGDTYMYKLPLA